MPLKGKHQILPYLQLVFVDYYSKWTELFPRRNARAETVSTIFTKGILTPWAVSNYLLSDQGPQFVAIIFEQTLKKLNLKHKNYHSLPTNLMPHLKTMTALYIGNNHKHWNKYLPEFHFALPSMSPLEWPQPN